MPNSKLIFTIFLCLLSSNFNYCSNMDDEDQVISDAELSSSEKSKLFIKHSLSNSSSKTSESFEEANSDLTDSNGHSSNNSSSELQNGFNSNSDDEFSSLSNTSANPDTLATQIQHDNNQEVNTSADNFFEFKINKSIFNRIIGYTILGFTAYQLYKLFYKSKNNTGETEK